MTQLTHWIPERWRETLANLRHDIYEIAERWLPVGRENASMRHQQILVLHQNLPEIMPESGLMSQLFASNPEIDLEETDDAVTVTADLPGLEPDDFTVEVTGARLVIRGEKKQERQQEERGYRYQERRYGAFTRALRLPCEVEADKAQANYSRGVLRVTLPKTESAKAKRVNIQVRG